MNEEKEQQKQEHHKIILLFTAKVTISKIHAYSMQLEAFSNI